MTSELLLRVLPDYLFTYHGHSLLITGRRGEIEEGLEGLYEHDTRLLSRLRLLVHGEHPRLDSISAVDPHSTLAYYVARPRADSPSDLDALGFPLEERAWQVVIRVARFVGQGMHQDVEVTNHGRNRAELELGWDVAADFADVAEARAGKRQQEAPIRCEWVELDGAGELRFDYEHPRLRRGVAVRFSAAGEGPRYASGKVVHSLSLGPQESVRFCVQVAPVFDGCHYGPLHVREAFGPCTDQGDLEARAWRVEATQVETPDSTVQAS